MRKNNKNTIRTKIRKNGSWKGYIVSDNVHPHYIRGPWGKGLYVEITRPEELDKCIKQYMNSKHPSLSDDIVFYTV